MASKPAVMSDADRKSPSIGTLDDRIDSEAASEIFDTDGFESTKIGVTGAVFLILNKMIGTGSEYPSSWSKALIQNR